MIVRSILKSKGKDVETVAPDISILNVSKILQPINDFKLP